MKILGKSDILMAVTWFAALFLSLPLIEPYEISRLGAYAAITLFAVIGIGRELAGPGFRLPRSPITAFVIALWLLALLSVTWTASKSTTMVVFADLSLFVLGFLVFSSARGIFRSMLPMMPASYLVLIGLAVWAAIQYFFLPEMLVSGGVRKPFADANAYAALMMLAFFPALAFVIAAVSRKVGIAAAIGAALLLTAIILIGGRAVFLLTLVGIVAMLFACRGMVRKNMALVAIVLVTGVAAYLAQYMGFQGRAPLLERSVDLLDAGHWSTQSRLDLLASTWAMIRDHMWTGTGFGTYFLFYPEYRLATETGSAGLMAHNDVLQYWAEMGIVAPLLLIGIVVFSAIRMGRVLCNRAADSGVRALCFGLFLGAGLLFVHTLTSFDLYVASILCFLGPVFGLWLRYSGRALGDEGVLVRLPANAPTMAGWAAVALPTILFLFVMQSVLLSNYFAREAQVAGMLGNMDGFRTKIQKAANTDLGLSGQPYVLMASVPAGWLQQLASPDLPVKANEVDKVALIKKADELLDVAEARNPRLVGIYYYRGVVARYGLGDSGLAAAKEWFTQGLKINPQHVPTRMMLADMVYQEGDAQGAVNILKAGLSWPYKMHDPSGYYMMTADIARKAGDEDTAVAAIQALQRWTLQEGTKVKLPPVQVEGAPVLR